MKRNVESRVVKLERRAGGGKEVLLLWRRRSEDVDDVVDAARDRFAPGDRVMCALWYGSDDPPAPAWYYDAFEECKGREREYLKRWLDETCPDRDPNEPCRAALLDWTNADLTYMIFRVET